MNDKLLKNGLYNAAAGAIRIGLAVLTIPVLIRLIGVEEYGLWTLASAVVTMVTLAEAGLSTTTTVFVSQDLSREDSESLSQTLTITVGAMLILATLAAIALWLGAENLVNYFPKLENSQRLAAVQALQIAGIVVWARLLQQVIIGVEQAYQQYAAMNIVITIQSVASNVGLLIVAGLGGKTLALMQYQAIINLGILIAHIWLGWLILRHLQLYPVWNRKKILVITRYSLMTWLASLGGVLFTQCDRIIVGGLMGTEILGVYAAITNITSQINVLSALIVQPLLPALSNLIANPQEYLLILKSQIKRAFQVNILTALGIGILLFISAYLVMYLIMPSKVTDEIILAFRIATIIYTTYSMNAVGYYILFAVDAVQINLVINLLSGILSLSLIYFLGSRLGLTGAILGNAGYLLSLLFIPYALKQIHLLEMRNIKNGITH
ncbi:oligosaccharide flippase family protein [Calothrix sp. NIES-2098]|uniref:oligosaccharide flippase family protein n=1 Tax=Calothrix sp. NIES-2098 TaxID=1954171 RepID=UPI000B5ED688|nr:polysaccharide biosynthesis protein [Calothrix sp. NIES-2098]